MCRPLPGRRWCRSATRPAVEFSIGKSAKCALPFFTARITWSNVGYPIVRAFLKHCRTAMLEYEPSTPWYATVSFFIVAYYVCYQTLLQLYLPFSHTTSNICLIAAAVLSLSITVACRFFSSTIHKKSSPMPIDAFGGYSY